MQLNPAMRGASEEQHRVLGGSFTYGKAFTYALFLGLQNVGNFEFATKNEAIVDAPWVRLCASYYGIAAVFRKIWHIHTSRGHSTIARSVAMVFPTTLKAE